MSNRRWILYVLGISLLVPFLLEGWTFYAMFTDSITGRTNSGPSVQSTLYGEGDEVLPSTDAREVLRSLAIAARGDQWTFRMTVDIENTTGQDYRFLLSDVVLQDGTVIEPDQSTTLGPGESTTFEVSLSLPDGTIPRLLRVAAGSSFAVKRDTSPYEIPLASVAVRRESGEE